MLTHLVITPYLVGKDKADLGPKVFFLWGALCCSSLVFGKCSPIPSTLPTSKWQFS